MVTHVKDLTRRQRLWIGVLIIGFTILEALLVASKPRTALAPLWRIPLLSRLCPSWPFYPRGKSAPSLCLGDCDTTSGVDNYPNLDRVWVRKQDPMPRNGRI